MPYSLDPANVDLAFGGGSTVVFGDRKVTFSVRQIARLFAATGSLGASDPFIDSNPTPFTRRVSSGDYPVELALGEFENGDTRVAFARLSITPGPVARWELALTPGQDPGVLGPDEYFGYGVDAGTGCFMDSAAAALFDARMSGPGEWYMELVDQFSEKDVATWSWLDVLPDPARRDNVIFFSSGWGDGYYPSFFGLDEDDAVACLVTDFMVLDGLVSQGAQSEAPASTAVAARKRRVWRFWERRSP